MFTDFEDKDLLDYNEIRLSQFADDSLLQSLYNSGRIQDILSYVFYKAYDKTFGDASNFHVDVIYLDEDILIQFFEIKKVVEKVYSEREEIELSEARKMVISAKIGDFFKLPFDKASFSKESIILALRELYEILNIQEPMGQLYNSEDTNSNCNGHVRVWHNYYDEYKNFPESLSADEAEEFDAENGNGYFDDGPNPFPFNDSYTEDDYGDESYA